MDLWQLMVKHGIGVLYTPDSKNVDYASHDIHSTSGTSMTSSVSAVNIVGDLITPKANLEYSEYANSENTGTGSYDSGWIFVISHMANMYGVYKLRI